MVDACPCRRRGAPRRESLLRRGGGAVGGPQAQRAAGEGPVHGGAVQLGMRAGRGGRVREGDEGEAARVVGDLVANDLRMQATCCQKRWPLPWSS